MRRALFGAFANLFKPDLGSRGADGISLNRLKIELLSGLTVALALVPEAVAFAFVAGVNPLVGLYAAFIVGLVSVLFVNVSVVSLPINVSVAEGNVIVTSPVEAGPINVALFVPLSESS